MPSLSNIETQVLPAITAELTEMSWMTVEIIVKNIRDNSRDNSRDAMDNFRDKNKIFPVLPLEIIVDIIRDNWKHSSRD